jgi:type II secretory pathway pseudopilin PulG
MSEPTNGGISLEGFGSKVSAQGRGPLIVLGFLIVAGAIVYDGWVSRNAMTAQTKLLTAVLENQKQYIEGYVTQAGHDHLELKTLCLKERFSGQFLAPTR